jgi:hypothetical protein
LDFLESTDKTISSFPYTYMGLPLNIKKPSRTELQPLVQKIANKIPG